MDDTYAEDRVEPGRSAASTIALAAIGLADASSRRIAGIAGFGVRAVTVVGGPVWRSPPAAPVRRASRSALERLVEDGARHERLWSAETRVAVTERVVDVVVGAAIRYALVERVVAQLHRRRDARARRRAGDGEPAAAARRRRHARPRA